MTSPQPSVVVRRSLGRTRAVVVVLHGGTSMSREATMARQGAVLRMLPFAWAVRRRTLRHGVAVWRLRYRYRGWNGTEMSPVADARWVLEQVAARHGDVPVVLLGHSMGGRTAVHVAHVPAVRGLVLLAPWIERHEPLPPPDVPVAVFHGDRDTVTSPQASLAWAARAGDHVAAQVLEGADHAMLRRPFRWHRLASRAAAAQVRRAVST